jgi:hypothetical protein
MEIYGYKDKIRQYLADTNKHNKVRDHLYLGILTLRKIF